MECVHNEIRTIRVFANWELECMRLLNSGRFFFNGKRSMKHPMKTARVSIAGADWRIKTCLISTTRSKRASIATLCLPKYWWNARWGEVLENNVLVLIKISMTTLPETNMEPENGLLNSFWGPAYFQVLLLLVSGGVTSRKRQFLCYLLGAQFISSYLYVRWLDLFSYRTLKHRIDWSILPW